jgi:hypothetical protein
MAVTARQQTLDGTYNFEAKNEPLAVQAAPSSATQLAALLLPTVGIVLAAFVLIVMTQ